MNKSRGLVKAIVLIVVALVVLGFFGYNLRDIVNSPTVSENLRYAWGLAVKLWNTIFARPALWLWDNIVIDLIWNNAQKIFKIGAPPIIPTE